MNNSSVRVFVMGGNKDTVQNHFPAFIQYLGAVCYKMENPDAELEPYRSFKTDSPADMTMMVFLPDVAKVGYSMKHGKPLSFQIEHIDYRE